MFTRREAAVGGLLTILSGSLPCICRAEEARTRHTIGCVLDDDEVDQYLTPSIKVQLLATGNKPIIGSSGNPACKRPRR
jgi:hypothetical protein